MAQDRKAPEVEPELEEPSIERTTIEARQAGPSRLSLRVLLIGLPVAVAVLALIYLVFFIWSPAG